MPLKNEYQNENDTEIEDDCCVKNGNKCLEKFPFRYFCVNFWFFIIGVTAGAAILQNIPT